MRQGCRWPIGLGERGIEEQNVQMDSFAWDFGEEYLNISSSVTYRSESEGTKALTCRRRAPEWLQATSSSVMPTQAAPSCKLQHTQTTLNLTNEAAVETDLSNNRVSSDAELTFSGRSAVKTRAPASTARRLAFRRTRKNATTRRRRLLFRLPRHASPHTRAAPTCGLTDRLCTVTLARTLSPPPPSIHMQVRARRAQPSIQWRPRRPSGHAEPRRADMGSCIQARDGGRRAARTGGARRRPAWKRNKD